MGTPIKGVSREPSSRERVMQSADRVKGRERTSEENPEINWESQTGAIESALTEGRLTLESGLTGKSEKDRKEEIRVRVWDMYREGLPFYALREPDKKLAVKYLREFAEDENHQAEWFDLQTQIETLGVFESLSAEDEDMMAAELVAQKQEAKSLAERAPMPKELQTTETLPTKQEFFGSPSEFDKMIGRASELGFSEQSGLTFKMYTEMKNRFSTLQKEMNQAGFFRRVFGLGVKRAEFRELRSQLDALDRLASEAVNRPASTVDNRTGEAGRARVSVSRARRDTAARKAQSLGKGKQ
ncbi:MAG: hypothetical protein O3B64_03775 [bacterium]|nr:hypothetical protein [bacterium]